MDALPWPAVFCYVCETWSLTLRDEHKVRMFEKQDAEEEYLKLRGVKRQGDWRKLHNEGAS
jgi:hypothetical protein